MSMDDVVDPAGGAQDKPELALDLNFVPTWARKPPAGAGEEDEGHGDRPDPGWQ